MTIKFYNKNFYSTIYNLRHNSSFINSQQNGVKLKITNLNTIKDNFSSVEIRNINRELNFFGVNLLYINGLSLNIELKDGLINISQESLQSLNTQQENDVLNFIKVFNKGIKSNNPNYLLNNTKFYLLNYRNKNLILTLDQIDDLRVNKKCFDLDGNLIVKVKDTLKSNGELSREDENSILIYKGTDIIFAEKKQKIRFSVIPFRITHQFYKN